MIDITLPLRTPNLLNGSHGHWRTVSRLRKQQRGTTCMLVRAKANNHIFYNTIDKHGVRPLIVTLTRLSAGELDDDGLRAALKSVRDGVADAFGTDDSSTSMLRFEYAQAKCKRGTYGVRVEIA